MLSAYSIGVFRRLPSHGSEGLSRAPAALGPRVPILWKGGGEISSRQLLDVKVIV